MKTLIKNTILLLTLSIFVASPFMASADSKGKNNKTEKEREKTEERMEKRSEKNTKENKKDGKKCLQAWGHLIAFGWLKKNNSISVDLENCNLPFGIGKKIDSGSATSTDTTAPIISGITSHTGINKALIVWNTDEKTTGKVYYSTSSPVNLTNAPVINGVKGLEGKSHFAAITGLASSTTYYFIIEAKDKAGNVSKSSQSSFTTKTGSTTDITAPIISATSSTVGTSTIQVSWSTNEPSTSKVYYSTSTPINTALANFVQNGAMVNSHNLKIENLSTSTLYYLIVESIDASTNTATSSAFSTTTAS